MTCCERCGMPDQMHAVNCTVAKPYTVFTDDRTKALEGELRSLAGKFVALRFVGTEPTRLPAAARLPVLDVVTLEEMYGVQPSLLGLGVVGAHAARATEDALFDFEGGFIHRRPLTPEDVWRSQSEEQKLVDADDIVASTKKLREAQAQKTKDLVFLKRRFFNNGRMRKLKYV